MKYLPHLLLAVGALLISCKVEEPSGPPVKHDPCGNGIIESGEECDEGVNNGYDRCDPDCQLWRPECGDGVVEDDETCDTGDRYDLLCPYCEPLHGVRCDGEPSVCEKSGLPGEKVLRDLSDADLEQFCEWGVEAIGAGRSGKCGAILWTVGTPEDCIATITGPTCNRFATATVEQIEACVEASRHEFCSEFDCWRCN
jgi:hypothetical protein